MTKCVAEKALAFCVLYANAVSYTAYSLVRCTAMQYQTQHFVW
jgi:hypothetical protein